MPRAILYGVPAGAAITARLDESPLGVWGTEDGYEVHWEAGASLDDNMFVLETPRMLSMEIREGNMYFDTFVEISRYRGDDYVVFTVQLQRDDISQDLQAFHGISAAQIHTTY